jgi:hypothetical protein
VDHALSIKHLIWSRVLQECFLEDGADEKEQATSEKKSSKDKKSANGQVNSEANLMFKLSHKVPYKTVFKGNFYIILFAV